MSSIRPRRRAAAAAACALLLPVLSGCFSGPTGGAADGGSGDRRLRVAMAFPPAQAMSPYGDDAVLLSRLAVVESLTALDENGTAEPALATSWKRNGDSGWTFELRDADFQDGEPVTAEAVARSLTAAAEAPTAPRVLSDTDIEATARDENTVEITTDGFDPLLPQRLASPSLAILSEAAYGKKGKADPAGHATGPYTLRELDGTATATLERHDGYWGKKAQAPGVDVRFVADGTARANALRAGETDVAEAVPVAQAAVLDEKLVHEVPTARTNSLYLNTAKGVFADAGMRAAARTAVDGQALVDGVYEGRADPARGLLGPALPWAAERRVEPEGRAAPAKRAEVRRADEIVLATYTNRAELAEVAGTLQQQLERAGFTVRQVVRDYAQMEADALDGAYDAFILPRNTLLDTGDPVSYLGSDFTCDGSFNISQLCDKAVDRAVAEAAGIAGTERRQQAEMRAEAEILGRDAVVPLLHERFVQGVAEDVEGVSLDPMERTLITAETRVG
ncbi:MULTISPECIES: ABC transporter substrate-binding protein [Streptomyces]|uniref:ABC transporter substrate-binding protein n=1 Tax=Streptomyces lycii TaxID=2654337 RepID=A0ABQ7FDQ0_9ACTN|nr:MULTISPECIES: ABC transporter substrate-binding protein [Streptomyces]KAF4406653.1 ABC transporter substrate-binding protein [Streptomyces lycii]PGH47053.1 ABC transporter substrate-binding protein [Streptomyces sp. Ru87]